MKTKIFSLKKGDAFRECAAEIRQYAAPQPAEQKPAPDVAGLVEALMSCTKATSAAEVDLIVDAALAAYRKRGVGK